MTEWVVPDSRVMLPDAVNLVAAHYHVIHDSHTKNFAGFEKLLSRVEIFLAGCKLRAAWVIMSNEQRKRI
jgi:hypothetical protein